MELSKNTQHWIAPNALTIGLNFDGMPDYIQVSVLANAVILSYIEGVIGYDQSHNYRKWYISAFNTKLSSAAAHYVYARLDKGGTTALIVYDTLARNIYGATDDNPGHQDENFYYVYLGKISPNYDESTLASKARIWEDGIHYGMLSTPESPYQSIQVENDIRLSPTSAIIIGDACLKYDAKNKALYTEYKNGDPLSFYTTGGSSAKGISPKGESGGGGASALYQLNDVLKNATEDGVQGAEKDKVLMFNGTHWYAGDAKGKVIAVKVGETEYKPSEEGIVTLPEFAKVVDKTLTVDKFIGALEGNADTATKLKNALTIQKNKTEVGVFDGSEAKTVNIEVPTKVSELENDSKFLTEHQKLYALTIQGNGKQLGVYTPNEAAKSINITPSGIGAAASSHTHTISDVTNLQTSLDSKLNASIFTELFEKVLLSDGVTYAIRAKYGFYSDSFVSAKGVNSSAGGSAGGASSIYVGSTLYTPDVEGIIHLPAYPTVPAALKNPYALTIQKNGVTQGVYDGSLAKEINLSVPTKVSELTNDSNFLTAHQTLYALTIQGNGTSLGVYTPNSEAKSINITAAGIGAAATTHKQAHTAAECTTYSADDNTMGVTPAAVKKAIGLFEPKAHTHNVLGSVTAGSSSNPVYFNAGVPTAVDKTATFNALVNSIAVGFDAPTDADYYISQYVGGGTENTTYRRRSHSALYAYIKGKAEGTWGINISGNAATATKLQTSRKIWGQAFDGSADVSGALTGVTSITIGDCVITYDSTNKGLKFSTGIYSEQYVSAKGANSSTGGSTGGAASIKIGSDLYTPDGEGIIHLPAYPTVPTSLKNPYALTIQANGTSLGAYDGSAANTLNITYANVGAAPSSHVSDTTQHITSSERTNWNNSLRGRGNIIGNGTPTSSDFTSVGTLCGCWNAGSNTNYGNLIQFYSGGGGSTNYVQFWSIYSGDMMWRNSIESTLSSRAWRTLIDSVNFSSYAATKVHTHAISDVTGLQTKLDDKYSSSVNRIANTVLAAPNGASGSATFRKLVLADLPSSVNSYTNLGLTDNNYSDYTWFVIGLFSISDTYRGGTGTSQGVVYISRDKGAHWNFSIEYVICNYYSQTDLSQANQKVRMMVRQMTVVSSMKPCTFIYKGVKYAGLAWTSSSSPHKAKVMASYAQCEPFLIRYYRTSSSDDGEAILNSEIYNSIRIDDTDITYQSEYLFGDLRIFNGSIIASTLNGVSSITTTGSFNFYPVPSDKNNYYLTWGGSSAPFLLHNYGKITFESSTGYYFNNSVGINVSGNTINGANFKLANDASNPHLQIGNWYLQVKDNKMYLGSARAYSPSVDSNGYLILPANSRRIYFNGNTTDNQCIVYDTNCARICVGSSEAKGFNVGSLLVSSAWGDSTLVPTNGIYSKGDIYSAGAITAKASSSDIRLKRDLTEYDALSIVRSHRSVKYHWNMTAKRNSAIFDDDDWHYGLIAQELQREHPQLVKDVFGDYLTIDYERLIPILWRAVQQLAKRNEELEVKLNEERRA